MCLDVLKVGQTMTAQAKELLPPDLSDVILTGCRDTSVHVSIFFVSLFLFSEMLHVLRGYAWT